jgi:hypothetical protein
MGKFSNVQQARIRKTQWFFERRAAFLAQLVKEVKSAVKSSRKRNLEAVFRLNGTSDIRWETFAVYHDNAWHNNIMEAFPAVQFYDYTKIPNRRNIPANYHLTFSRSETNEASMEQAFAAGMNVAVVFLNIPEMYMGRVVFDGTTTDLRFMDPRGVFVGLEANGKAKRDASGFVVV